MFFGSIPALVTPFAAGRVDEAAFRDLVEWQIDEGSNGLVPCGTTGEAATLSTDEHRRLIELTVEVARGRVPVIAGCGSNNTAHAIELTQSAKAAGADAALHVPPYYNRPNQDGIYAHLRRWRPRIPWCSITSRRGRSPISPSKPWRKVAAPDVIG